MTLMKTINRVIDSFFHPQIFSFRMYPQGADTLRTCRAKLLSPPPATDSCHTSTVTVAMLTMLQAVTFPAAHCIQKPALLLCRLSQAALESQYLQ